MARKRFFWHLFPSFLLIILLSLAALGTYATISFRQFHIAQREEDLAARAYLVRDRMAHLVVQDRLDSVETLCTELGNQTHMRLTVILPRGKVIGDTREDPGIMDNHSDRPEIITAMGGAQGVSVRHSSTLDKTMMYVAIPALENDSLVAVVRSSMPLSSILNALSSTVTGIMLAGIVGVFVIGGISAVMSRRFSIPVEDLTRGAELFSRGDLKRKLVVPDFEELGRLADAMNAMAADLHERITTITQQRNEHEAILSCMVEGVVAVNADEHLISINHAAAHMLGLDHEGVRGRLIQEVIRNSEIQGFVRKALALSHNQTIEEEIFLSSSGNPERFVQLHGTVLSGPTRETIGALIVFNDVTRLKRLESIRKDFVANVSHELRTPLTSIQGFVETLLQGAMNDPADCKRFLEIVANHVDRLNTIIEDLLILSRIEKEAEYEGLKMERTNVIPILKEAVEVCQGKASQKHISVELTCDPSLQAVVNPFLFEQAVINLIDNAIKYSDPGKPVNVLATRESGKIMVSVRDQGVGIAPSHHSRLFERFYRVDKARSRKVGGTGLGLAIVKHIMRTHRGNVTVNSLPGKGSTFTLHIPSS